MEAHLPNEVNDLSLAAVVAVDDRPLFREVVCKLVRATPGMVVVGEAACGEQAVDLVEKLRPDLVLMDVQMPGIGGVAAAHKIKAAHPSTIVALISATRPEDLPPETAECRADVLIWKGDLRPRLLEEVMHRYRLCRHPAATPPA
jgi:two-component system invasion response regulator UvrY